MTELTAEIRALLEIFNHHYVTLSLRKRRRDGMFRGLSQKPLVIALCGARTAGHGEWFTKG